MKAIRAVDWGHRERTRLSILPGREGVRALQGQKLPVVGVEERYVCWPWAKGEGKRLKSCMPGWKRNIKRRSHCLRSRLVAGCRLLVSVRAPKKKRRKKFP